MPINWQQVITTLGGGGVVLVAAAWLIKALVTDRLARDAEKFRMDLKAKSDSEIERLKNALEMAALEHQVRFSKLHEKRAEVIAKLYAVLAELQYSGQKYVFAGAYEPKRDDEFSRTAKKVQEVFLFIEEHQIYLPDRVCTLLEEFVETVNKSVAIVHVYEENADGSADFREQKTQALIRAAEEFKTRIPAVRKALTDEFRTILGVENSHPQESQV